MADPFSELALSLPRPDSFGELTELLTKRVLLLVYFLAKFLLRLLVLAEGTLMFHFVFSSYFYCRFFSLLAYFVTVS